LDSTILNVARLNGRIRGDDRLRCAAYERVLKTDIGSDRETGGLERDKHSSIPRICRKT